LALRCLSIKESGGFYNVIKQKSRNTQKYNLLVIRISHDNKLVNARPCYNCLDMLNACKIKKIYYSTEDGIMCENVSNMVSINSSSVTRLVERTHYNAANDDTEYYTNLLLTKFPSKIKINNLQNFLKYNLKNVLPHFRWSIKNENINFYNQENKLILSSIII
jgi:hypothetical protein